MDLKKIGSFIATKRKEQGYTQAKLGELLGVTNKAVSKWERGVCLPDAVLYTELCTILGITINELFAGEDLDESEFKQKADRNLTALIKNFTRKGKMMKICIAFLAIMLIIVTAVGGYAVKSLVDEGYFKSNYIKSYSFTEGEELMSNVLKKNGETPYVFEYKAGKEFYGIRLVEKVYKNGKLVSDDIVLESSITGGETGYIIVKVADDTEANIIIDSEKGSFMAEGRQVSKEEYESHASVGMTGLQEISDDETELVASYYTNKNGLTVRAAPEIEDEEQLEDLKNVDCHVLYSCEFVK